MRRLLQIDADLSARLRLSQSSRWWKLAAFLAHSGDSWFWMLGLVFFWFFGNSFWHRIAGLMAAAVGGLAVFVLIIKFSIRRQRPPGDWGAIYRNTDPHSFPSGHAARAGLLAVLACGLGPLWFGILVVLWAPFVSLARVLTGVHYLSDVVAGLALGIAAGFVMLAISPWVVQTFSFLFF
jgi:membrane-associated phospholipid phosphatase